MKMLLLRKEVGEWLAQLLAMVLALGLAMLLARPAAAMEVRVEPDRATILKISGQPSTVVVGNPLYATVHVMDKRLIIQGRHKGKTNVIVLDVDGNVLARFDIVVTGEPEDQVAMYVGSSRITYLCKPDCAPLLTSESSLKSLKDMAKRMQLKDQTIRGSAK